MAKRAKPGPTDDQTSKSPAEAPKEIEPGGEQVEHHGGSGAPQGGRIHGRQGDQQGQRY